MRFLRRILSTSTGKAVVILVVILMYLTVNNSATKMDGAPRQRSHEKHHKKPIQDQSVSQIKGGIKPAPAQENPVKGDMKPAPPPQIPTKSKVAPPESLFKLTPEEKALMEKFDPQDWVKMGNTLRLFKKIHNFVWERKKAGRIDPELREVSDLLEKLEKLLFNWIKPGFSSTIEIRSNLGEDEGLVMCAGNGHVDLAVTTLRALREVHGWKKPIEIFYTGPSDLTPANRKRLQAIPNLVTRDITEVFDNNLLDLSGWAVKAFALLASSFKSPMLIDADVAFFQSPDVLFKSEYFQNYGALFFHDRSLFAQGDETLNWFRALMPKPPSPYSQSLRTFKGQSGHEQESGVVLINKVTNLPGLLATCLLNVGKIRNYAYDRVFGDKETFWLGFEIMSEPYIFNTRLPGTAGVAKKSGGDYSICSRQIVHFDHKGVPVWVNGGISVSKYDSKSELANMQEYVSEPGDWQLHSDNFACLSIKDKPTTMPPELSLVMKKSGEILLAERKQ